ncbi:YczE/YyaS/YitT family protein [Corynebacterium endometrii]|uniref:YitT family protein n=1 Tax=Corynebacterium endometrii TaxID=2488819 RepID=A0A4P7QEQ7_9CORY|nr:DUF6198 family protein [Corynebacterium endometrii]QCB27850.1 hypothetical protein CENDO_02760 [Corynebacterium endometrii]
MAPYATVTRRYTASFIGICIGMAGTAIISLSALGTSPISSTMFALSLATPLSFGGWTFVLNALFIVAQLAILRKKFPKSGWLQIPALLVASVVLDFWMWLFSWIETDSYLLSLLTVIAGIVVAGGGLSLLVASKAIYMPGEGLVAAISETLNKPFPRIKVVFDLCNVVVALILCIALVGNFEAVREATIISAFGIGFVIGRFIPLAAKIVGPLPVVLQETK